MSAEILVTVDPDVQIVEVMTPGPEGPGAPRGGATNQVVAKASDADLDFKFVTLTPQFVGAEPAVTSGTTSDYWRGDKTWRNFFADVRAATLTGLSTAVNAVVTAADTVLSAIGKLQAQVTGLASSKLDVAAPSFGGNSATATKLQTARTINGVPFDGSANITTANWGTARTITIGNTGKSVNGSADVSWSLAEILGIGVPETAQEIGGGVDLDTIQTPGFYLQPWDAQAASGTNYPAALAGALVVLRNAGGVSQLYYTYGSASVAPRAFFRALYSGSWSTWREFYHSGNLGAGIVELANIDQTAVMQALSLASMAHAAVDAMRNGPVMQRGEIVIRNRGVVSGCAITKSTSAARNLNISSGACFARGATYPVVDGNNAASVPANTSGTMSVVVSAYLYPHGDGQTYCLAVTAIGQSVPEDGIEIYRLTIPPNNTDATDPYLAQVALTDVRRIEPHYPDLLDAPPMVSVAFPRPMRGSDWRISIDLVSAAGGASAGQVLVNNRAPNGCTLTLASAADDVRVRYLIERLHD